MQDKWNAKGFALAEELDSLQQVYVYGDPEAKRDAGDMGLAHRRGPRGGRARGHSHRSAGRAVAVSGPADGRGAGWYGDPGRGRGQLPRTTRAAARAARASTSKAACSATTGGRGASESCAGRPRRCWHERRRQGRRRPAGRAAARRRPPAPRLDDVREEHVVPRLRQLRRAQRDQAGLPGADRVRHEGGGYRARQRHRLQQQDHGLHRREQLRLVARPGHSHGGRGEAREPGAGRGGARGRRRHLRRRPGAHPVRGQAERGSHAHRPRQRRLRTHRRPGRAGDAARLPRAAARRAAAGRSRSTRSSCCTRPVRPTSRAATRTAGSS